MSYPYIELDLRKIEQLGKRRENENIRFRTFLKGKDPDRIDPMVNRLNEEISARIDCTTCANCCKKLAPCISETDIEKLSQRLELPKNKIRSDYLESDQGHSPESEKPHP